MEFHLTKKQETSDVRSQDEANYGLRGRSPGTGLPKVAAAPQQPAKDCQSCSNHGEEHFFYTMAPSAQPSCTSHPIGGGRVHGEGVQGGRVHQAGLLSLLSNRPRRPWGGAEQGHREVQGDGRRCEGERVQQGGEGGLLRGLQRRDRRTKHLAQRKILLPVRYQPLLFKSLINWIEWFRFYIRRYCFLLSESLHHAIYHIHFTFHPLSWTHKTTIRTKKNPFFSGDVSFTLGGRDVRAVRQDVAASVVSRPTRSLFYWYFVSMLIIIDHHIFRNPDNREIQYSNNMLK